MCCQQELNMLKNRFLLCVIVFTALFFWGCAKRGAVTGGAKDTIPPVMTGSFPKNMTTSFKGNEIHIDFNEYIKIKDVNKQLIISPPMDTEPTITPNGSASKYIDIKIKDTLKPNTTYSFNFGQSITDNNESNPYSQFKFVFSTGTYIDSLTLNGQIKDAFDRKTDNFVTVMLYEADSTFTDSTIYKKKPRYVTNTLDSLTQFSLQNLKEGKYYLLALKDVSNNYKFNPSEDKIAFLKDPITVPTEDKTVYQLELFKEKGIFKPIKPAQTSSNRLYAPYPAGIDPKLMKVSVKNGAGTEDIRSMLTKVTDKDSLNVWLPRDIKQDSLQVTVAYQDSIKNFRVKFKEMKAADSLSIEAVQKGGLHFREKFMLKASTPLTTIDSTKISLIGKDSLAVPFTFVYDDFKQQLTFDFAKKEDEKYIFTLLPGAITDFYAKQNDTLTYKLATKNYSQYGNMRISLANVNRFPVILEILGAKDEVYATQYIENEAQAAQIDFEAVEPNKYVMRIIYDDNKNRIWDTGSYLQRLQPEQVIYYPKEIDVREMWDVNEKFILTAPK